MNPFVINIAIVVLLDLIAIVVAKYSSIYHNISLMFVTALFFAGAGFFYARSLQYEGMAIANIMWISISIILVTFLGYFFFKEHITPLQLAGIGVITIGLVMIELGQPTA